MPGSPERGTRRCPEDAGRSARQAVSPQRNRDAVGPHALETKNELAGLLEELRSQIQASQLPEGAKNVLLQEAVPEMDEALRSHDPKSGFQRGLDRIDDRLQGVGAVTEHVSGILSTVTKIAKTIGIGLSVAAPYIAARIWVTPAGLGPVRRGYAAAVAADAHVLVPLKRLDDAKSRLAGVLPTGERSALMLELLSGVLAAIKEAGVGPITVVSAEELSPNGVSVFDDRGLAWNDALAAAMREVVTEPVAAVVSADLPTVTADDVRALVAATPEQGMAIARALDGGTNAVSMRPAGAVMTHFGEPQSAAVHAHATAQAGLAARIVDIPGLAFDIDTPDDLEALRKGAA